MHHFTRTQRTWVFGLLVSLTGLGAGNGCSSGSGDGEDGQGAAAGSDSGGNSAGGSSAGGSSSGGETAGGTGGETSGGSTGDGGQATAGSAGAFGGMGGGGGAAGLPTPNCNAIVTLSAGMNYGDYSVFAVRLELATPSGEYSFRVRSGDDGTVAVFTGDMLLEEFSYDPQATLGGNQTQTLSFPGLFEIDLRSNTEPDLSALDESIFDGCHAVVVTEAPLVMEGAEYGPFRLVSLVVDDAAPSGNYTFFASSGNSGQVELRRDGVLVETLDYDWMTTIGGGTSFEFDFPGIVSFSIERPMGTSNLFGLADLLFDGRQELRVE